MLQVLQVAGSEDASSVVELPSFGFGRYMQMYSMLLYNTLTNYHKCSHVDFHEASRRMVIYMKLQPSLAKDSLHNT